MSLIAFRGATAWEAQVGRVCFRLPFPRYWRGTRPRVYLAPREDA